MTLRRKPSMLLELTLGRHWASAAGIREMTEDLAGGRLRVLDVRGVARETQPDQASECRCINGGQLTNRPGTLACR